MTPRAARRTVWHASLAAGTGIGWLELAGNWRGGDAVTRASLASAWVGLALLAWTLAIGPWRLLRGRPVPVSFDVRRDVAVWAGLWSLAHTVLGLCVHMRGRPWEYFLHRVAGAWAPRGDSFGLANDAGLVAALILLVLLVLSNDLSLGALGAPRWKRWQRASYVAMPLVVAHGFAYQGIENRPAPIVVATATVVAAVLVMQARGFVRRRAPRAAP